MGVPILTLPIAIAMSVLASAAFAAAAVLQHEAIGHQMDDHRASGTASSEPHGARRLGLGFFRDLLRRPKWWIGFGLSGVGALLNLTALSGAPVSVVQPITVLSVPFAVLLGMWRSHRRPNRVVWLSIAAAMLGVSTFVSLAANNTSSHPPATSHIVISGLVVAGLVVLVVLATRRAPSWVHSLGWATGAAGAYGLAAAYMKAIFVQLDHDVPLTAPTIWLPGAVLVIAYPVAGYLLQHALVSGAPEVVIGGLTVIDPILAVLIGAYLLGEGSRLSLLVTTVMVACGVLAVLGVVVLSRYHPDAERVRETHPELPDPPALPGTLSNPPALAEHTTNERTAGENPVGQ